MSLRQLIKDGWGNLMAGLGKLGVDKTESNYFEDYRVFEDEELSNMYDGDGMVSKIVNVIPNDMTRVGWKITNDKDDLIEDELKRLKARSTMNTALKYARLFGGALIVMVTERGQLDEPLPPKVPIKQLRVYSAARVILNSSDIVTDSNSLYFEDFEKFEITLLSGESITVHRSRCLLFKGELTSDYSFLSLRYKYWGYSIIQKIWSRVSNLGVTEKGVANLMIELVVGKYTLSNLTQILSQNNEEALKKIYTRLEVIQSSKSLINAVLLGEGEKYERDSANIAGVADVIDRMMLFLSAVTDIPVTKLFGRSPAGFNATGESDVRDYYDKIFAQREIDLYPELKHLVQIVAGYLQPNNLEDNDVLFNSLWEPTQKEKAEIKKLGADTDLVYINAGVLNPMDVQKIRFPDLEMMEE